MVDEARAKIALPGELIAGRYRIVRSLGSGSSAHVYEAAQLSVDRRVALKIFHGTDAAHQEAARVEANHLSKASSHHCVVLYDRDETEDGHPILAMEFVDGPTLQKVLATGAPVAPRDALIVLTQLAEALAAAHRRGVVHGDIKSANLVLVDSARGLSLKVLDFGISSMLGAAGGPCSGTWNYMAPEQIEGAPPTPSMDIFASGVVLHEMLGDAPRFDNAMDALDEQKRRALLRLPRPLSGGPLDQLLTWMTAADPKDRCPDGASLLRVLDGLAPARGTLAVETRPGPLAKPGQVRIASGRRPSSGSSSSFRRFGPAPTEPVPAGRGVERQILLTALDKVRDGVEPALLLLGGERGLGKRSLLHWLVERVGDAERPCRCAYIDGVGGNWSLQVLAAIVGADEGTDTRSLADLVRATCAPVTAAESTAVLAACGYLVGVKPDPDAIASLVWKASAEPLILAIASLGASPGLAAFVSALTHRMWHEPRPILLVSSVERWRMDARSGLTRMVTDLSRLPCVQLRLVGALDASEVLQVGERSFRNLNYDVDRLDFGLASLLVEVGCGNPQAVAEVCAELHAQGGLVESDGTLALGADVSPTPLAPPEISDHKRMRLLERVVEMGGDPEPLLLLARRCAILGHSFDVDLLREFLLAEAQAGHDCAHRIVMDLEALLTQLGQLDVLMSITHDDWQFSQALMWRALDGFSDRFPDAARVHELAAAVKAHVYATRGEPAWRLREVELHAARATVLADPVGIPGWSGHALCWLA